FGLMNEEFNVATLHDDEAEIRNGETTELVIDLTPTGRGPTARIVGHVRVDGRDLAGARVEVQANERVAVETDPAGRFETPPFAMRSTAWVTIQADLALDGAAAHRQQLYQGTVQLAQDEVHEIELDLYPHKLHVRVLDSDGQPVAHAQVSAQRMSDD